MARTRAGAAPIDRFRTQKTAALLAYLAYYPERAHRRDQLIELLWPGTPAEAGRNRLSIALNSLREQLEPDPAERGQVIGADRSAVRIRGVATDVAEFDTWYPTKI